MSFARASEERGAPDYGADFLSQPAHHPGHWGRCLLCCQLYLAIVAGPRHLEVVELLGRPIERRALLLAGDDLTDSDHAGLRAALDR
ncbi:MAG: hypothetical protein ACLQFI_02150, partial [Methylocella sp.]